MKKITFSIIMLLSVFQLNAQNYLQQCIKKQLHNSGNFLVLQYTESRNNIAHRMNHWSTYHLDIEGELMFSYKGDYILLIDSIQLDTQRLGRKVQYWNDYLLLQHYGKDDWADIDQSKYNQMLIETLRYNPAYLLDHFLWRDINKQVPDFEDKDYVIYNIMIDKTKIQFTIRKSNSLIDNVLVKSDFVSGFGTSLGDVEDIYSYSGYQQNEDFYFPSLVRIDKTNKHIVDEVKFKLPEEGMILNLEHIPLDYKIKNDITIKSKIKTKKYSDHIYLVNLEDDETNSMLVEFSDFFVALEAPTSSENGELIINEAKRISPQKPIKYFIAGHFHPHYLGGVRAFVHKEATILSIEDNYTYILEQVNNPHSITPDSLQVEPKPLIFENIDKSEPYIISDGKYEMQVIFIGDKSDHTFDYLVFYFPQEKLLYQGDLVFIPQTGEKTKLSKREMSCYNVIKDYNLQVDTILQAWPIRENGVKWIFPFSELEQIVNMQIKAE